MMERRRERRIALEILYQKEISGGTSEDIIKARGLFKSTPVPEFARRLISGVIMHMDRIDALVDKCADNWSIDRMAVIDRTVLRICSYELIYEDEIPIGVSINEAVELAKMFGDEDSSKFVNGLAARIAKESSISSESSGEGTA